MGSQFRAIIWALGRPSSIVMTTIPVWATGISATVPIFVVPAIGAIPVRTFCCSRITISIFIISSDAALIVASVWSVGIGGHAGNKTALSVTAVTKGLVTVNRHRLLLVAGFERAPESYGTSFEMVADSGTGKDSEWYDTSSDAPADCGTHRGCE